MREIRICFVGDSITLGQGDTQGLGWPGRLCLQAKQSGHDITGYNLGIRGDTSTEIAGRWRLECDRRLPKGTNGGIIFMFGVNDMAIQNNEGERVPMQSAIKNATAILSKAAKRHRCLWIGPTPVGKSVTLKAPHLAATYEFARQRNASLNAAYQELALKIQVPFLDLHNLLSTSREWRDVLDSGDGVHPTPEGHACLAKVVAHWQAWRDWLE